MSNLSTMTKAEYLKIEAEYFKADAQSRLPAATRPPRTATLKMVATCDLALRGNKSAIRVCAMVIADAAHGCCRTASPPNAGRRAIRQGRT
jgi:hypothetical protein